MMRIFTFVLACFISLITIAQNDSANMPFRLNPSIPPFDLLRLDSATHLTKADINPKHRTMIMFFSPECSHCQHQTEDMIVGMDSLKDVQIIMATYQPFNEMVEFNKKYQIAKYSNIKIGRDIRYFFPPFYRMKSLPYLALYDNRGMYITSFEGNQKVATIVTAFNSRK